jgi:hypothetical protein
MSTNRKNNRVARRSQKRRKIVFVAAFADGETARMSTYCDVELAWERGRNLVRHAWQARDRRRRIEAFLVTIDDRHWYRSAIGHRHQIERFLARIKDREPPEITSCHFEVDGQTIEEPPATKSTSAGPEAA